MKETVEKFNVSTGSSEKILRKTCECVRKKNKRNEVNSSFEKKKTREKKKKNEKKYTNGQSHDKTQLQCNEQTNKKKPTAEIASEETNKCIYK